MIGDLRAAHYHRYELPLLSAPVNFRIATGASGPVCPRLVTWRRLYHMRDHTDFATADPELAESLGHLIPGIEVRRKSEIDYVLSRTLAEVGTLRSRTRHCGPGSAWINGYAVEH